MKPATAPTAPAERGPATVGQLLFAGEETHPDAIALLAPGCTPATYRDLAVQTRALAGQLADLGLGPGDRLALVLPDGPEMAAAFPTLAASVGVAPLNPAYREEDFDFHLTDLRPTALVLPAGQASPARQVALRQGLPVLEAIPHPGADPVTGRFDLVHARGPTLPPRDPFPWAAPEDTALLLHTSGTTSRPKLVPLTHRNVCASAGNIAATLALSPADRGLGVMPLFHIHGLVGALLSSLRAGASFVATPGFAADRFFDWLAAFQPTWFTAVPTMHQAILEHARQAGMAPAASGRLRLIRSSSSALPPSVMEALESRFGVPVLESYGMTEAAHQMASNPLPPRPRRPGSVGPAAGPEIAILDPAGNPLPSGTDGEVCIRGTNVTAGYRDAPAANTAAFAHGWFRTGDQGRLDGDGYLFLTGRLKEIVNRGGEKISPRAIDEALLNHPRVRQAVAFAVPHPTLGEDLAAAVVAPGDPPTTEEELRLFLLSRLPPFQVPTRILLLPEIPKGPTGKIQRIGLAQRLARHLAVPHEPPRPGLESDIADAFREILALERIGRNDNFFALGGDSIRATRTTARAAARLNLEIPATTLFRHPTLATFAAALETLREEQAGDLDALVDALARLPPGEADRLLGDDGASSRPPTPPE